MPDAGRWIRWRRPWARFRWTRALCTRGCETPDPPFFAFTRGRLSVLGHGLAYILHVAQSQYHDIGVARRLGYKVCWIERRRGLKGFGGTQDPGQLTTPDYHFATLGELADAVEAG